MKIRGFMIPFYICKFFNKFFPLPSHPFNLNNEGISTYSRWQYEKGAETIKFYLERFTIEDMFKDKTVVDIGCGAAGKTLYYASLGVNKIYGVEVLQKYEKEAIELAESLQLSDKFTFITADAAKLPFEDNSVDTIIMNDAMEHVDDPELVLKECIRVLTKGGKIFINFPPYYHPFGAHLSDAIGIPWVHMFFSEKTLIKVYVDAIKNMPDAKDREDFRISYKDEKPYFSYINKMTVSRFKRIMKNLDINPSYYKEVPLRNFFIPLSKTPSVKEMFVKMVVCVIEEN